VVWLQDSITVIGDKSTPARPGKLRGIMVDITDRKRAEAALQQSEARFRRVVDSNLIGIYFWDITGKVLEANDAFLKMLGYTREELEAGRLNWRAATPPEFRYLADRALEQMRHFGASRPFSKEFLRRDGSRVPVLIGDTFLEHSTDRGVGFVLDITERRIAEDRQALMLKELDHRVKNNMMAVLTLTEQCLRAATDIALPPRAAVENLLSRLRALARTHQALAHNHWTGATLRTLVRHTLEAFRHGDPLAFSIEGEETLLPPRVATVMAMALHELATNALKYGALSVPTGHISVRWEQTRLPDVPRPLLRLIWHESGGPSVQPPVSHGFGLELIKGGLSYESHGRVDVSFDPSGLRCEILVGIDDPDPSPSHQVVSRTVSADSTLPAR
jgi:PAS domain S-box-containing protein